MRYSYNIHDMTSTWVSYSNWIDFRLIEVLQWLEFGFHSDRNLDSTMIGFSRRFESSTEFNVMSSYWVNGWVDDSSHLQKIEVVYKIIWRIWLDMWRYDSIYDCLCDSWALILSFWIFSKWILCGSDVGTHSTDNVAEVLKLKKKTRRSWRIDETDVNALMKQMLTYSWDRQHSYSSLLGPDPSLDHGSAPDSCWDYCSPLCVVTGFEQLTVLRRKL